jgi:hypothetical protein
MAAITNGLAAHGGFKPYAGTFLVFSDYARNALRMASLMGLPSIFVLTHDVNQLRLERSKDDSEPVRATRGGVSAEEKHAAFAIARRLNADWDLMFAGVAVAGNDGVTWLSLNGDLGQGSLGVVGEARTLPSMFDFLTRLEASPGIADARLSSYEFRRDGAGDIVRFNVVAKWAGDQQ